VVYTASLSSTVSCRFKQAPRFPFLRWFSLNLGLRKLLSPNWSVFFFHHFVFGSDPTSIPDFLGVLAGRDELCNRNTRAAHLIRRFFCPHPVERFYPAEMGLSFAPLHTSFLLMKTCRG